MIYLASPYSHPDGLIREKRFLQTRRFVAVQLKCGVTVFSPVVYGHQFVEHFSAPTSAAAWKFHNDEWMVHSAAVWVLRLTGWEESEGIAYELATADRIGLPIDYKDPI